MTGSAGLSILIGVFVASSVEVAEMVIIVVGVGATRGWRSTWVGVAAGLTVLVGIVAGLGQALQLIPINIVRVVIGALLLTFGLQWFRQGVIQTAADGFSGGTEEEEVSAAPGGGSGLDWTAFVLAFKGVLLEGLEVAFIVVAFGAGGGRTGSGGYGSAYIGAAAAFVVMGTLGFIAKQRLQEVPGRTLKFGVGGLLSTFGTFWALEGLGVHWPGNDLSLAWLYALYLSSTFALMLAVRNGLMGPVPASALHDQGPAGPTGLAPASSVSVRDFQKTHDLAVDGVVGPQTRAALQSVRALRDAELDVFAVGVDAADAGAVAALQQRLDLPVTGDVDAVTRGAIRLLQQPGFVDPLDERAVRHFQDRHGLEVSGEVDEPTRVALGAVLADSAAASGSRQAGRRDERRRLDPLACFHELDPADERSVCRFQASLGIPDSGDVDGETRGAMRAMRAWLAVDPLDAEAVRDLQRRHGLEPDGVIGPETRRAIEHERRTLQQSSAAGSEPDPYEEAAVRRFQRRYGLEETDGTIGPETRAAILWEREHHLSVDAASGDSVRAFQRRHGLPADGILGPLTQAAMRAARSELETGDDKERRDRYGEAPQHDGRTFDPADEDAVRSFQREHRLTEDGTVGPRTRTAIGSVRRERARRDENDGGAEDTTQEEQ